MVICFNLEAWGIRVTTASWSNNNGTKLQSGCPKGFKRSPDESISTLDDDHYQAWMQTMKSFTAKSPATLRYRRTAYVDPILGRGGSVSSMVNSLHVTPIAHMERFQSIVYMAMEEGSGRPVALKKSRVSRNVKRPTLQHEARVLQLLRGLVAIPVLYGYGHLDHFEYLAMELLGPSIADQQKKVGAGIKLETVLRILNQAVRRI